ncbi:aminoacyl-histidine dipeptidase [Algivirga pacifica]|uniref:Aminoacyl-histidine dipeptidase n=1 Tax=Algivirga pacifica TaxID=1162670 RepID=A0ABP9D4D9_9BACT
MNTEVASLSPSVLWTSFEELNSIPRPSKKEERVIAFLLDFGKNLGLETVQDAIGNVIIRKPATPGMEDRKTVVLQAHVDMVCVKNAAVSFDFDTQGIESYIDNGWVKAKGTTLGADNGIGAAAAMAVLRSKDIEHGPVEALFTIDEETGMTGAAELDPNILTGSILLNMDTEDEGELCIGCAGGIDTNVNWSYTEESTTDAQVGLHITLRGLKGGHSGCDIHLGRGNANKLMNRLLWGTYKTFGLQVQSIDGGSLRNAIPRESFATVVVSQDKKEAFIQHVNALGAIIKDELSTTEPSMEILVEETSLPAKVMTADAQEKLLAAIYACPNGVTRMSADIEGLVETSTSLARIIVKEGTFESQSLTRSSVDTAKLDVANQIESGYHLIGATVEHSGSYPGWTPNPNSEILTVMQELHKEFFKKDAIVNAVHAGLECGIIGQHYPEMDMISFGPTIKNAHSPDEMCEIETVDRFWGYLLETLKRIPKK